MDWEFAFLNWIQENLRCGVLDFLMPIVTFLGSGGWFWIALTLLGFTSNRTKKYAHISAVALILCLICGNLILKPLIARVRPFDVNTAMQLIISAPTDFSFPSGHTQASFAAAVSICLWKRKWGIPALVLAALIAFSRMYLYVHYPTDVLAGLLFGVLFAFVGYFLCGRLFRNKPWDGCRGAAPKEITAKEQA